MKPKPKLKLIDEDGNSFFIIGRAMKAARKAGFSETEMSLFRAEATSGDYNHLIQVCYEYFEVI